MSNLAQIGDETSSGLRGVNLDQVFQSIADFFDRGYRVALTQSPALAKFVFWFEIIGSVLSLLFLFAIAYLLIKLTKLQRQELADLYASLVPAEVKPAMKNERWAEVSAKIQSDNPADWKVAIIEADAMLDEVVKAMGYRGDNLGERLKAVEPSDFLTLNDAWEAHKVRNAIAHEAGFLLTKREVGRVIQLYENVFREFEYV